MDSKSTDDCAYKTEKEKTQKQGRQHVKTQAEIRVILPQAKEFQGLTAAARN